MMGFVFHFLSVALMALSPVLNKFALAEWGPLEAAFWNSVVAGIFGLFITGYSGVSWNKIIKSKTSLASGICNGIGILCLFAALSHENPLTVGMIGRLYIPLSALIGFFFLGERVSRFTSIFIAISFIGMIAFVWKPFSPESYLGVGLSLIFSLAFAFTNTFGKLSGVSSMATATFNNLVAAFLLFPFYFMTDKYSVYPTDSHAFFYCSLSGILGGCLGLSLFFKGLKYTSLLESNLIRATSPLFVAAYSSLFFTIELSLWNIIGGITVIGACLGMACEKIIMKKLKDHSHQKMAARPASEANNFPALCPTPGTTAKS